METPKRNVVKVNVGREHSEESKSIIYHYSYFCLLSLCKEHFQQMVKNSLRKELRNLYRGADKAYSSMDFSGIGFITETDFLNSMVIKKIDYTSEELRDFFFLENLFKPDMNFDTFKKTFFPHLYLITDDGASD